MKEPIEIKLSKSDVNNGRIVIQKEDRGYFDRYQNVKINDIDYHIYDSGSSLYISKFTNLHKQHNAQEGSIIRLTCKGENQFEIEYSNKTNCSDKKSSCIDTPYTALGVLQDVLDKMKDSYQGIIVGQNYLPTRDRIGFTERNLTFYFCHHYLELRKNNILNIIVWQEMPLESDKNHDNDRQHIDSIIIDKHDGEIEIFYIEAKRIYDPSFVTGEKSSLQKDYERIIGNRKLLPDYSEIIKGSKKIHHHVVLLAGLEIYKGQRDATIGNKHVKLEDFRERYFEENCYSKLFIGGIDGSTNVHENGSTKVLEYEIHTFYSEIKENDTTE